MASKTEICNMALSLLGEKSDIQDIDNEASRQAKVCRLWYTQSRKETLAAFDWNFARHEEALADLGSPPDNWGYRYQYPSGIIKMREIKRIPGTDEIKFEVRSKTISGLEKVILCDVGDAVGIMTLDITTTDMFTPWFTKTMALSLAGNIAIDLTQNRELRDESVRLWRESVDVAGAYDAEEGHDDEEVNAPWIDARE